MRESLAILLAAVLGLQYSFQSAHAADAPASGSSSAQTATGSTRWYTQKSEIAHSISESVGVSASTPAKSNDGAIASSQKGDASSASVAEKTAGMAKDSDAAARD